MTRSFPPASLESLVRRKRDCPTRAWRRFPAVGIPFFRGRRRSDLKNSDCMSAQLILIEKVKLT